MTKTKSSKLASELIAVTLIVAIGFPTVKHANGFVFKKACRNLSADIYGVDIPEDEISIVPRVSLSSDNDTVILYADIQWSVYNPKNIPLDGFAVFLSDTETKKNNSFTADSIVPENACASGKNHMWVNTQNQSACDVTGGNIPQCFFEQTALGDACLCPQPNCSLFYPAPCRATTELLGESHIHDHYLTILPTVRSLTFRMEFQKDYQFFISPYYREFANLSPFSKALPAVEDCPTMVMNLTGNYKLSHALCCKQGVQHLVAQNITIGESRPDFAAGTYNVTITWLPPGASSLVDFRGIVWSRAMLEQSKSPKYSEPSRELMGSGDIAANDTDAEKCIYNPTHKYQMEVYNLLPNMQYRLELRTKFNTESPYAEWCKIGIRCSDAMDFELKSIEACDQVYEFCDAQAACIPGVNSSSFDAVCMCSKGTEGDGYNPAYGWTGCKKIDACFSNHTGCVSEAICTNQLGPNTGVNCSCPNGYYGDGYETGSGCSSRAVTALAVALPLAVIFVIVIVVAVWMVHLRRKRKRDMLFNKFVVDGGILMMYEDPAAKDKKDQWEPTFGDAWEIDRETVRLGEVIGRGNYGVVHMAWLSEDKHEYETIGSKNGEYRNGGFYDALSASPENDNGADSDLAGNSTPVAVKKLQESTRNHENLANFLAEIGFMLNIGRHENILLVHGCCTTQEPVYLVTEFLQYGDLLHFLWDAREPSKGLFDPVYKVTEQSLCIMSQHVAKGMQYLEQIRVIHGDIAARNILVGANGLCKISDFGLANDVYRYGSIKGHKERFVPFKWISPERMMTGEVPITSKSDVWSFGNLMYEMFTLGCSPHPGIRSDELLAKLRSGYRMQQPKTCSDQIYGLMNKCWKWRASARPTFSQLVKLLDAATQQGQHTKNGIDLASVVDKLDKELYAHEVSIAMQPKENGHANGNISFVEIESENRSRAM